MPMIRPSSDLRNNYNEISNICHQTKKPVYITKNGVGDLAVMSIELYELLVERYELYNELEKGINSLEKGEKFSAEEVYDELDKI
jgi:prevent-host-death family protein